MRTVTSRLTLFLVVPLAALSTMVEPPFSFSKLSAQQAPPVEVGTRVRVTAPQLGISRQVATLEAWRGDTLVLVADRTINCPLVFVRRLEVSRGPERSTGTSALVGLLVGGGLGAGLGFVLCHAQPWGERCGEGAAVGAAAFGILGAGVGALSAAFSQERWELIPMGQLRLAPVATSNGRFGLAWELRFW